MKHRIIAVMLCLFLLLPIGVEAVGFQDIQYVVDQADLLTDQENTELNDLAQTLSQTYQTEILIAAVDQLNGLSAQEYAVFLNSEQGFWDTDHAILFLLAREEREWYIATFGNAISIFTDYGLDTLGEAAVPYFSEGSYYDGFAVYLTMLPEYFQAWELGEPIDNYSYAPDSLYDAPVQKKTFWSVLPVSLLIGVAAAAVSLLVMRSAMNTKRRQHSAGDYLTAGSYHLRTQQDIFLYSNLSKTRRQENTGASRSGGGSSIHRSSGGRSHGGRGGKF